MSVVINTAIEFALSFTAFHAIFFFAATRVRRILRASFPASSALPKRKQPRLGNMFADENTVLSFKTIVSQRMHELDALESCYMQMRAECDPHDHRALERVSSEQALIMQQVAVMAGEFEHLSEAICEIEKRWAIERGQTAC
jgi:hypothetical protein